ncbi:hypothetical protein GOODEAATRI_000607 [Goodea atripinnis]|uniref:Uncharacterized protein n=1 Tax=Goodea atripinnis TaxID=208336 RepID=A0ABV0PU62_9TELE
MLSSAIKVSFSALQNLVCKDCNPSSKRGVGHRVALKGVETTWHDAVRQPSFIIRGAAIHNGANDEMLPLWWQAKGPGAARHPISSLALASFCPGISYLTGPP